MMLKRQIFILVTILGCLSLLGSLASCSLLSTSNQSTTRPTSGPTSRPISVKYEITGTASSVNVTLYGPTGGTEYYSNVPVPHTYSYPSFPRGYFLYIQADNNGDHGAVTVTIYVDGNVYKTSSGINALASGFNLPE